jgi:hypothetical protein
MAPPKAAVLPHDIRDIMPLPFWGLSPVAMGLAVLMLVLVVFLLWALLRYLQKRKALKKAQIIPVDHWGQLLTAIRAVEVPNPLPKEAAGNLFFELSLLLRQAIERRTRLAATDMTLQELKVPLETKLPLADTDKQAVWRFLERADQIKFADAPTNTAEALQGRALVEHAATLLRSVSAATVGMPTDHIGGKQKP